MPAEDDPKKGHKYPFNACEILCSENAFIIDKIMENTKLANESDDSDDSNFFKVKRKKNSANDQQEDDFDNNSDDELHKKMEQLKIKEHKNDLIEGTFQSNTDIAENSQPLLINTDEPHKIEENNINENNSNNYIEKSLLEKNTDDELNFAQAPEKDSASNNKNVLLNNNTSNKSNINNNQDCSSTDKENENAERLIEIELNLEEKNTKENPKKVAFSESTDMYCAEASDSADFKHRSKRGFHQKKNNIENSNVNVEKLIMDNSLNIEDNFKINDNESNEDIKKNEENDCENIDNNNNNNNNDDINKNLNINSPDQQGKENDNFLDLSDDVNKSMDNSNSSLNHSMKSEKTSYIFPNLDYLFEFFEDQDSLNYVLAGYFNKIFSHMINSKSACVMTYLYHEKPHLLDKFINNIQRKSICDCLCKLLTVHLDQHLYPDSVNLKISAVKKIFEKFEFLDMEALANVSDMIIECMKNKHFYFSFISDSTIFEKISALLIKQQTNENDNNCAAIACSRTDLVENTINKVHGCDRIGDRDEIFKNLLRILNKLNENIIKDFGNSIVTPSLGEDNEASLFNFQTMNLDGLNSLMDEELLAKKVDPAEIQSKLDKIYDQLCEISYKIIEKYTDSDKGEKEKYSLITTYEVNSTVFGMKRYLLIKLYLRKNLK